MFKALEEASAYLEHPVLGMRLRVIANTLLQIKGETAVEVFGGIDSMKVKSCMTLFDLVSPHDIFERVLERYYNGQRCEPTLERVGNKIDYGMAISFAHQRVSHRKQVNGEIKLIKELNLSRMLSENK